MYTDHSTTTFENQQHLLFCQTREELTQLEREARAKLSPSDNGYRAARFADGIVEIVRRRHRHAVGCSRCLVFEALSR